MFCCFLFRFVWRNPPIHIIKLFVCVLTSKTWQSKIIKRQSRPIPGMEIQIICTNTTKYKALDPPRKMCFRTQTFRDIFHHLPVPPVVTWPQAPKTRFTSFRPALRSVFLALGRWLHDFAHRRPLIAFGHEIIGWTPSSSPDRFGSTAGL